MDTGHRSQDYELSFWNFFTVSLCLLRLLSDKHDLENSEDGKPRLSSLKKKASSASMKLKNSFKRRSRNCSRVMSVSIGEDEIDAEELQAVDAFRQALILEELLPAKHDSHRVMLRYISCFCTMGTLKSDKLLWMCDTEMQYMGLQILESKKVRHRENKANVGGHAPVAEGFWC